MSSAYETPPWVPAPGEAQCEAESGWKRCQLPAGHRGRHLLDLGNTVFSWPQLIVRQVAPFTSKETPE